MLNKIDRNMVMFDFKVALGVVYNPRKQAGSGYFSYRGGRATKKSNKNSSVKNEDLVRKFEENNRTEFLNRSYADVDMSQNKTIGMLIFDIFNKRNDKKEKLLKSELTNYIKDFVASGYYGMARTQFGTKRRLIDTSQMLESLGIDFLRL